MIIIPPSKCRERLWTSCTHPANNAENLLKAVPRSPAPFRMMNDFSYLAAHILLRMCAPETGSKMPNADLSRLADTHERPASRGPVSKKLERHRLSSAVT
jgi:hypothetical protein